MAYVKVGRSPIIPLSMPAEGSGGKTGSWRIFRPVIHEDKCRKCMLCYVFCPEGVVGIVDGMPRINYDYCKGCGICANECQAKAIEMVREEVMI